MTAPATDLARLRDRVARPVVLLYWLAAIGGLALYSALAPRAITTPLWIGVIAGTVLGQVLALLGLRLWLVAASILSIVYLAVPIAFLGVRDLQFWLALLPAVLCGYGSLGERGALAAFWFPTVLWMLAILDRGSTAAATTLSVGAVMIAVVALVFVLFLRARESRRVALWRAVGARAIAAPSAAAPLVLREATTATLARAGWVVTTGAIACGLTAWLAPRLWQLEQLASDKRVEAALIDARARPYTPHDHRLGAHAIARAYADEELPCCPVREPAARARVKEYFDLGRGDDAPEPLEPVVGLDCRICVDSEPADYTDRVVAAVTDRHGIGWGPAVPSTGAPALPPQPAPVIVGDSPAANLPTTLPVEPLVGPRPGSTPAPRLPAASPPALATMEAAAAPHAPRAPAPAPRVAPPIAAAPTAAPPPPPPSSARWLVYAFVGALMFQLVALALRPLRRAIHLRHLRRPYWPETVDQRVSNAWQLALVGLRDAGWRATTDEAPREFAARTRVDGVDRCATILERARHGLGIDRGDLDAMTAAADEAYRSARAGLPPIARASAWLRWPLV